MEAVEDVDGRRAALADDVAERLPHVAGDEHDGLGALVAEHVEEGVEALGRPVPRHVQQPAAAVVDLVDEREVLVPLLPGQLVDADGRGCRRGCGAPGPSERRARRRGRRRPSSCGSAAPSRSTTAPSPSSRETRRGVGRLQLARRPRHRLDGDAAARAVDPAHRVERGRRPGPRAARTRRGASRACRSRAASGRSCHNGRAIRRARERGHRPRARRVSFEGRPCRRRTPAADGRAGG